MQDKIHIQEAWNEAMISNFIRRMLLYYDPMELTIMGAPDDEYDSYVGKVSQFLREDLEQDFLEEKIYNLFEESAGNKEYWRRKAKRMSEDLVTLLKP